MIKLSVLCPGCSREIRLKKDGTLLTHLKNVFSKGDQCPMSGKHPNLEASTPSCPNRCTHGKGFNCKECWPPLPTLNHEALKESAKKTIEFLNRKEKVANLVMINEFAPGIRLFRDDLSGIAWVEDGRAGGRHSAHPNISDHGSVTGMEAKGWWPKGTRTARSHGFIYNIDQVVACDELDEIAGRFCECFGCIGRKASATKERTTLLLQGARDALDLGIAGQASIEDFAKARAAIEAWLEGRPG